MRSRKIVKQKGSYAGNKLQDSHEKLHEKTDNWAKCGLELFLAIMVGGIQMCITYAMARDMTGTPRSTATAAVFLFSFLIVPLVYCSLCTNLMTKYAYNPPARIGLPHHLKNEYAYFVYGKYLGIAALAIVIACSKFIAPFDNDLVKIVRSILVRGLVAFNIFECAVLEWHLGEGRDLHYRINAVVGVFLTLAEIVQGLVRPVIVSLSPTWGQMFRHNVSPSWVLCYLPWNIKFGSSAQGQGEIWHLCASHVFAISMALTAGTDYLDFRIPALHAHFSMGLVIASKSVFGGTGIMGTFADHITMSKPWLWGMTLFSGFMVLPLVFDTWTMWNDGLASSIGAIVDYGITW